MKPTFVFVPLLVAASVSALAETPDEYAQSVAKQAERTVWRRDRDEAIAAAQSLLEKCTHAATPLSDVRACSDKYAADIDAILKDSYESSIRMDGNAQPALKAAKAAAQIAWLKYRNAECAAVRLSYNGGSGAGIADQSCRAELAIERVRDLESLGNAE
ncbi:lysozyme inhibitor LprI family protein [Burkholderia sp. MR1-5-21]